LSVTGYATFAATVGHVFVGSAAGDVAGKKSVTSADWNVQKRQSFSHIVGRKAEQEVADKLLEEIRDRPPLQE